MNGGGLKKVDRYVGEDKNGVLHNIEVHRSGVTPDTWICGNCGISLKDVQHFLGLKKGLRYCTKCFEKGKALHDMPDYTDKVLSGNDKGILWKGASKKIV